MEQLETRERLIRAAGDTFYQHGYVRTPLSEVATAAGVPLGNVYYHFKTKDSLLAEVIAGYQQQVMAACARCEQEKGPRQRLRAYFRVESTVARQLAQYGCPYGTLCQELGKNGSPLATAAHHLLEMQIDWVEEQLTLLGKGTEARDLATALIAAQQGFFLLAQSFRNPDLLVHQLERLDIQLETV